MKTKFSYLKSGDFFVLEKEYDNREMIPYLMIEDGHERDGHFPRYVNCLNGQVTCRTLGCPEPVYLLDPKFHVKKNMIQVE